ncbi:hypothetical protein P691DRAFT_780724 [Macrolepiota fuliginosa MF-IS2]|uniref:Uncharacterized protein n=1 Tax=Macrolepiota fuliginosa MF-IS2 TaxID=1400762 RepID=A0A9P5WY75_9AGAR|nr:hypothetical protein P691DRAFT_780724 [Macrolepiota fuliginosa MF-IS2]
MDWINVTVKISQLEITELINNIYNSNTSFLIIWVLIFARPDYAIQLWQEFLHIKSEESRRDTVTFICGQFKEIHDQYRECVEEDPNGCWPLETTTKKIIKKTSGLFVLTNTLLKHIGDSETQDPDQCLGEVLAFLEYPLFTGSQSPMHSPNLFYTCILSGIPNDHWPIIFQILVAPTFCTDNNWSLMVQPICNLLGFTHVRFYAAMWQLHSIINL